MKKILLFDKNVKFDFTLDEGADAGLVRVAGKVVKDYNDITQAGAALTYTKKELNKKLTVFAGIAGESDILDTLSKNGKIDLSDVTGKWEVYKYTYVDDALIIAGSDKLGAIYGLFTLSEMMGVGPLVYWADAVVPKKDKIEIEIDEKATKEPSVKFRGFFINDEWPCYGNWTMDHFGGFTAEMYDHVFELLLRLKGNYLWPAMWSSSFAWDGPGLKSFELASEYGIYMGNSHHEPCLRAGEEYRQVRGKDSIYGDAWNYHANTEGITRFWKDSMDERGMFTSMVTVGMRGEADTKILGENATLKDNIDLLKDVIRCQNKIIKETEEKYNKKFPKVLALYKEVEPFYYGDENTEGLCDWDELNDTILMLCEDNHGYLRTLPTEKMRKHPAGFGMYYHVDYHGSPISYEWINSSPLSLMWEQMSTAYEYGVRSVWILNVGDLKHNEFPLSYFLNLAYDFDKYGASAPNTCFDYTKDAIAKHFGGKLSDAQVTAASEILTETVRLLGYRRPEALNPSIYDACHFEEADRMLERVYDLEEKERVFANALSGDCADAWYSLSGFQTRAAVTLLKMHLYGAKNVLLANQGLKGANEACEEVAKAISEDSRHKAELAGFKGGKWKGMELASHVGFTKWNDDGARYPLQILVTPFDRPRLFVSRVDDEKIYDKVYGPCMKLVCDDFLYEETESVRIKLSNNGEGEIHVKLEMPDVNWLYADLNDAVVANDALVTFTCNRNALTDKEQEAKVVVNDGDTKVEIIFKAKRNPENLEKGTFMEGRFGVAMLAKHYKEAYAPKNAKWVTLEDYGIYDSGVKVYPVLMKYEDGDYPYLSYDLYVENAGEYTAQVDFTPTNPLSRNGKLECAVSVNGEKDIVLNTIPADMQVGVDNNPSWSKGVLDHRRSVTTKVNLKAGRNTFKLSLRDAGLVPLKIYLYKEQPPKSYFGMPESKQV